MELNALSGIHDMSAIWDVHYLEVWLYNMHPPSAILGPRSKKFILENITYIFEKWHFLAVIIKFFYILGNENPKTIPYNFSKESFPYSLENGNPLPPPKKKIFIFQEELPKPQKTKFLCQLLYIHYTLSTRKSNSKIVINPLSVSPAKWSNTLKQFVGSLSWYFRLQGGTFERLLRACGFKPNTLWLWFLPDLYDLPESMNIIWFHNKIWRHDGVTTALWQDQIIVVVCPIFFKCLNKLWCLVNRGFYP